MINENESHAVTKNVKIERNSFMGTGWMLGLNSLLAWKGVHLCQNKIDGLLKTQETTFVACNFVFYELNVRCFLTECDNYTVRRK